jgi:chromosome partitioning protein
VCRIISIISQKGGVGKTTTAVNLGACLGAMELKTLVVGLDPQCGVAASFGWDSSSVEVGLYDCITQQKPIQEAIYETKVKGFHAIPINIWTDAQDKAFHEELRNNMYKLKEILASVRETYDYVLIDCPPALGPLTAAAMMAADSLLIPVQCEYYTLATLNRLVAAASAVKTHYNPDLKIEGFLMTMVNTRAKLTSVILEEMHKRYNKHVLNTVIPRNIRLAEIPQYKQPVILIDILCPGAQAYLKLAQEIHTRRSSA